MLKEFLLWAVLFVKVKIILLEHLLIKMFGLPGTAEVWLLSGMQLCENSFSWYPGIKSINAFIDKVNLSDDKYGVEKRKVSTD